MNALVSGLAASLATVLISTITHHLKQRISYGVRWKNKKEQFDDIITKAHDFKNKNDTNCTERAHLENSIFSKFGWPMPAEAVTFLLDKKDFPYNLEAFHKSRRDLEFSNGEFRSKISGLGRIFASPKESHIKAVVRIGVTLTVSWGAGAIILVVLNLGLRYPTPIITAAFATATPLVLFLIYLLDSSTTDMRRNKNLLDLNNNINGSA